MHFSASKSVATVVSLVLMLTMAVTLVAVPVASAHEPPWQIPTYAYVAASPNPTGVGQSVFIVMWIDKVPPTAGGLGGDRWTDMTIKITKPNEDIENLGPFISDPTSSAYAKYTPDQTGTYKIEFTFPTQESGIYNPETGVIAPPDTINSPFVNDTFLSSTATTYLTVQDEEVSPVPDYPLPTEYWTRPIEGQNTGWASISSNWLGAPQVVDGLVQPDGVAPNSAHIMWTKPLQDGGIVGGSRTGVSGASYYMGLSYEGRWNTPMIMNGRLYYQLPQGNNGAGGGFVCVDLRTGEQLFYQYYEVAPPDAFNPFGTNLNPSFGQLYWYDSPNQHGVVPNGYLWTTTGNPLAAFFGLPPEPITWIAYDPLTGNWLFNLTDAPGTPGGGLGVSTGGSAAYGPNGEILLYEFGGGTPVSGPTWLAVWNNTAAPDLRLATSGTNAWQYRPTGKNIDSSTAYSWNQTLTTQLPVGASINYVIPDDMLLGSAGTTPTMVGFSGYGTPDPRTVFAISLKPGTRGNLLWKKDYPAPAGNITRSMGPVDRVNRVFTMSDKETMQWLGYDLDSGALLWGPVGDVTAFNYYGSIGVGGQFGYPAYGNLYVQGYGGIIYCYDTRTGEIQWTYGNGGVPGNDTNSGLENPWGHYPLFICAIADGKVYAYTNEHSPNSPMYKDSRVRCLNATTGEEIWTLLGWGAVGSFGATAWPVADGYLAYLNMYDMQVYVVGRGPSATSVMASPKVSVHGNSVLLEGTVIDTASGTKQKEQAARFPNGVPVASDESMSEWMEYIYMQKPMPQDAVGVEVLLQTLDPNGNFYDIGTAVTDSSGTYSLIWDPPVPGKYTVIATFQGSESYWPSYAETAIGVTEASPTPPPEEPLTLPPTDMYIGIATIVIVLAIAAVGFLILRKR